MRGSRGGHARRVSGSGRNESRRGRAALAWEWSNGQALTIPGHRINKLQPKTVNIDHFPSRPHLIRSFKTRVFAPLRQASEREWGLRMLSPVHNVRLNSATGYITPKDMLAGCQQEIHAERDRKLEAARKQRQIRRQQAA